MTACAGSECTIEESAPVCGGVEDNRFLAFWNLGEVVCTGLDSLWTWDESRGVPLVVSSLFLESDDGDLDLDTV